MSSKQNKQTKKETRVSNKIVAYSAITFAVLIALMFLWRGHMTLYGYRAVKVMIPVLAVFAVLIGVCVAIIYVLSKKKGKDLSNWPMSLPEIIGVVVAFLIALWAISEYHLNAVKACYIIIPVAYILFLVYFIYEFDFFVLAGSMIMSFLAVYGMYRLLNYPAFQGSLTGLVIAIDAVFAVALALAIYLKIKKGRLTIGSKSIVVFPENTRYTPLFVFFVAAMVLFPMILVYGATFAYYSLFAVGGCALVAAIYYTVRLMYR